MHIESDVKLDFNDVLFRPKRSTIKSRKDVMLNREFSFKNSRQTWSGIPIVSSNMSTVTTPPVWFQLYERWELAALPKNPDESFLSAIMLEDNYERSVIATVGINYYMMELEKILSILPELKFVCLDVANGYMERVIEAVQQIHVGAPNLTIVVGNVVTPEMTEALILAGADIVKVGIGSGSACITRSITGVGYPQLSAIIECGDAAHGIGGHIMADGGCVTPGDVAKAFGAGADFVMLGGMLAGHNENGPKFFGMSSKVANEKHAGGLKNYRAAEGRELELPARGPIANTLQEIEGGLRSACSYVGARKLKYLPKCTTFIKVNRVLNTSLAQYE